MGRVDVLRGWRRWVWSRSQWSGSFSGSAGATIRRVWARGLETPGTAATSSTSQPVPGPAVFPSPSTHAQAAFDASTGTVVLFGGQLRSGPPADGTWLFRLDNGRWSVTDGKSKPPSSGVGHAIVYVDSLAATLLYGGGNRQYVFGRECLVTYFYPNSLLADTWLLASEGSTWRNLNLADGPGPR